MEQSNPGTPPGAGATRVSNVNAQPTEEVLDEEAADLAVVRVGLAAHGRAERAEGRRRLDDGHRAAVERLRGRRPHHLGIEHAALGVHRHVHHQFAVELLALVLGEVARAALLDLAAQLVVVERVDLLARGRADVALLGPGVFVVDALFNFGQQLDELAALGLLRCLLARVGAGAWVGRGQLGHLLAQ